MGNEQPEQPITIRKTKYEVIKELGRGGFGRVIQVKSLSDNNLYAIKEIIIKNEMKDKIKDIEKEAIMLSKFDYKNIVKYYDSQKINNKFYILMEYCGEQNLRDYIEKHIKKNELIEENILYKIIKQICIGIKKIHKKNIIHRDIKPENIFMNEKMDIKIGDFGISKYFVSIKEYKTTENKAGTIEYSAPEIRDPGIYNKKSDMYSLGCIIYELFNLRKYYDDIFRKEFNKIDSNYNYKWQEIINSLLQVNYNDRMDINKVCDIIINEININEIENELENERENKLESVIENMNINNPVHSLQFVDNKFKTFNIKFIGEGDYLIKRIRRINFIETIDSIKFDKNKLILSKGNNEIIFNLIEEKGYLNNTYHKPDCIIFVFDFENQKNYNYMKLCCKYYIKNYNLIYLFGINFNKNNTNKYIENDVKQFADSNNLKFIHINEDNENYIKDFLNNLIIELEKKENKNIINQVNVNKMKKITPRLYKIVLLGDSAIGAKSSLLLRLSDNSFREDIPLTVGVGFTMKHIKLKNGNEVLLRFMDTSGQDILRYLSVKYYNGADYIVIGYDVTNRNSFKNIKDLFGFILNKISDKSVLRYLIGNKIDLCDKRQVSEEEGRALANELNLKFFEISCKDDIGIDEFYDDLINDILDDFDDF